MRPGNVSSALSKLFDGDDRHAFARARKKRMDEFGDEPNDPLEEGELEDELPGDEENEGDFEDAIIEYPIKADTTGKVTQYPDINFINSLLQGDPTKKSVNKRYFERIKNLISLSTAIDYATPMDMYREVLQEIRKRIALPYRQFEFDAFFYKVALEVIWDSERYKKMSLLKAAEPSTIQPPLKRPASSTSSNNTIAQSRVIARTQVAAALSGGKRNIAPSQKDKSVTLPRKARPVTVDLPLPDPTTVASTVAQINADVSSVLKPEEQVHLEASTGKFGVADNTSVTPSDYYDNNKAQVALVGLSVAPALDSDEQTPFVSIPESQVPSTSSIGLGSEDAISNEASEDRIPLETEKEQVTFTTNPHQIDKVGPLSLLGYLKTTDIHSLKKELDRVGGLNAFLKTIDEALIDIALQQAPNKNQSAIWLTMQPKTFHIKLLRRSKVQADYCTSDTVQYLRKISPSLIKLQIEEAGGFYPFLENIKKAIIVKAYAVDNTAEGVAKWLGLKVAEYNEDEIRNIFREFFAYLEENKIKEWSPIFFWRWCRSKGYKDLKNYLQHKYNYTEEGSFWDKVCPLFMDSNVLQQHPLSTPKSELVKNFAPSDNPNELNHNEGLLYEINLLSHDDFLEQIQRVEGLHCFLDQMKMIICAKSMQKVGGKITKAAQLISLPHQSISRALAEANLTSPFTFLEAENTFEGNSSSRDILSRFKHMDLDLLLKEIQNAGGILPFLKQIKEIAIAKAMQKAEGKTTKASELLGYKPNALSQSIKNAQRARAK